MENENLVTEVTENVDETTEETQLTDTSNADTRKGTYYTKEQLDEKLNDRYKRGRIRGQKEAERKYAKLETILKQGLGVNTVPEAEEKLSEFYKEQGVEITSPSDNYSDDDIKYLAERDAEEIITDGDTSVDMELQRLADLGANNMTKREKVMFEKLHQAHMQAKSRKEFAEAGGDVSVLETDEYKEFSRKLNPELSEKEKYEMFSSLKPKPKAETMGSMSNHSSGDLGVKEFYTFEEASNFTKEDFDKNPELFKAVENSMSKW